MPGVSGPLHAALSASIPLVCFLTAVIWLARIAEATGLAGAIAGLLSRAAGARTARVYALVCIACALLTVALSLDGAVVVMVPVVLALADRGAPARPLLLATIGVANAFSIAVVQGNPTNLVVMTGLHLGPATFDATMVAPGLAAALICAGAVALRERRSLGGDMGGPESTPPLGRGAAVAAAALGLAGAGESLAPVAGIAPWWPACAVAAGAALCLAASRVELPRPAVPWRIGVGAAGRDRRRGPRRRGGEQPPGGRGSGRAAAHRPGRVRRALGRVGGCARGHPRVGRDAARLRPRRPRLRPGDP